ncbi:MAG: ABC-2 family transporter protein [Methanoregula sp. PtaU1.Bin051]|nr:MAG: ABC-2 family transporter protein [Methanoregula sp. PtaU1.Bin051]
MIRGAVAIFKRDFKKFLGNPFVLVFTLLMPIMYLVIFGNAMGGTITHIPIGVVQEGPPYTETGLYVNGVEELRYFSQADNPRLFDVTVYTDEEIAKRALGDALISGVVVFPSEISKDNMVRLYVDSSDYMTPTLIESGVRGALARLGAGNTIMVNKIYGDIKYIQFFGVGVIVMAIFMTTMMGGGIALIKDREMGIHEGYLVTPVKRSSIILGMISSGTVRAFLAGLIIFVVGALITGVIIRSMEDFLLVLIVIFIASVGVTSLMVSIASRFNNQQEYASTTAFFNLILFMTSGAFYPTIGMPDWLRWITVINPEWYSVHALRSIILRGQGLSVIAPDLIALLIFSAVAILLGITTYRRTLE